MLVPLCLREIFSGSELSSDVNVRSLVFRTTQFWPGEHVGECVAHIWQAAPTTDAPQTGGFMGLLNVVATEDFPLVSSQCIVCWTFRRLLDLL